MAMEAIIRQLNSKTSPLLLCSPKQSVFKKGVTEFLMDGELFADHISDVTHDLYSPWTGSYLDQNGSKIRCKTHSETRAVKCTTDFFVLDGEGVNNLIVITNTHPLIPSVQRKIAYVLTENKKLCSNVWFCYSAQNDVNCSDLVNPLKRKRKLHSEYDQITEALANRTTAEAKKILATKRIYVSTSELSSLSRTVPSHVKSRKGRKPATNATKLMNRLAANHNKAELLKPVLVEMDGEKVVITQVVVYPMAIRHFVKALPYKDELDHHKRNIRNIENLDFKDAQEELNKYLNSTNLSGSLPLFGSSIFIDTTFSLVSGEYVTIAIGLTDQFRTRSGKNASFLLGVMIHSKKNLESHERFSQMLNECLARECPDKRVPSIITDGESAFRVYQSGLILGDCVPLRCDLHRSENMKLLFKNDKKSFMQFKERVFGKKVNTPHGVILKGGLLGVLSRKEFDRKLQGLMADTVLPEVNDWLVTNACSLFETNSLIKKLEGGWPAQQFLTTNIIEGRNAYLKDLIQSPVEANQALDKFLKLHENEMRDRRNALILERSPLVTDFSCARFHELLREEKVAIMKEFGFEDVTQNKFDMYPSWVSSGDGKIHRDLYLDLLKKIVVDPSVVDPYSFISGFQHGVLAEPKEYNHE